jgi:hypothetical protein
MTMSQINERENLEAVYHVPPFCQPVFTAADLSSDSGRAAVSLKDMLAGASR